MPARQTPTFSVPAGTGVTGLSRIRAALWEAVAATGDHAPAARRWRLTALPGPIADPGLASTTGARRALGHRGVLAGAVLAGVGGAGIAIVAVGIMQALRALPGAIADTGRARRPGGGRLMLAGGRPAGVERARIAIVALGVAAATAGNRGQDTAAGGFVAGVLATDRSCLARAADPAAAIRAALLAVALRRTDARASHAGVGAAAGAAGAMAAIIATGPGGRALRDAGRRRWRRWRGWGEVARGGGGGGGGGGDEGGVGGGDVLTGGIWQVPFWQVICCPSLVQQLRSAVHGSPCVLQRQNPCFWEQ